MPKPLGKYLDYHMLLEMLVKRLSLLIDRLLINILIQIKMFTSSNLNAAQLILRLETLRDIEMLGPVPISTFTELIRVLSLLSKTWNMNSKTFLWILMWMLAAQIKLKMRFGGSSIKEQEGQRSF